jgi:hypothetical protein
MIAAPMPTPLSSAVRARRTRWAFSLLVLAAALAACGSTNPTPTPRPSTAASASARPTPPPSPSPTPAPTPRYTNEPDDELTGLIPDAVGELTIVKPAVADFAITPGDFGEPYGELGLRFASLQVAYITSPRLSLYAARADGPPVTTEELEPYLAEAGRYVGIAGLVREPWALETVNGNRVWVRPEDNATVLGTMIYTWAADEYVFLLIGTDDAVNRALIAQLPGEAAPTPTPRPSRSPSTSASADPSQSVPPS